MITYTYCYCNYINVQSDVMFAEPIKLCAWIKGYSMFVLVWNGST